MPYSLGQDCYILKRYPFPIEGVLNVTIFGIF